MQGLDRTFIPQGDRQEYLEQRRQEAQESRAAMEEEVARVVGRPNGWR